MELCHDHDSKFCYFDNIASKIWGWNYKRHRHPETELKNIYAKRARMYQRKTFFKAIAFSLINCEKFSFHLSSQWEVLLSNATQNVHEERQCCCRGSVRDKCILIFFISLLYYYYVIFFFHLLNFYLKFFFRIFNVKSILLVVDSLQLIREFRNGKSQT